MGWYVQCEFCKREEKYRHPDCDCRLNQYVLLQDKIKDKEILNEFMYGNGCSIYTCSQYDNVCTLFTTTIDKWISPSPYPIEISLRSYHLHELYALGYTDESLDQLFMFYQFLQHQDLLSVIGPLLNAIDLDDEPFY